MDGKLKNKRFIPVTFQKNILKMIQFVIKDIKGMYVCTLWKDIPMMASQIHVSLVSNCTGDEKLSDFFGLMRTLIIIQK